MDSFIFQGIIREREIDDGVRIEKWNDLLYIFFFNIFVRRTGIMVTSFLLRNYGYSEYS